jgi:YGGT family protein
LEERERTVTTRTDAADAPPAAYNAGPGRATVVQDRSTVYRGSGSDMVARLIDLIFGVIIGLIVLRVILLLLAAREGNNLVSFVYNVTDVFVAPFRGILRIDEVSAGQSALDVGAIVAIVGWFVIYLLVRAILNVFRREPTAA